MTDTCVPDTYDALIQTIVNERCQPWDREDASQEGRITVWQTLQKNPDASPAHLAAAIRRQIGNLMTGQRAWTGQPERHRGTRTRDIGPTLSLDHEDSSAADWAMSRDHAPVVVRRVWLERALAALPHDQRTALQMRADGEPWAEVQETLGCSRQHANRLFNAGRDKIKIANREGPE